jgi:uncharacterized protein (DUF1697 family)
MPRYVVFLRAINVGGRTVKMNDLAAYFRDLGFSDAKTFIASGNLILQSPLRTPAALQRRIHAKLAGYLGFEADAFVRSEAELRAVTERALALQARLPGGAGETNVCFLQTSLSAEKRALLKQFESEMDAFSAEGTEVYWSCRGRQSDSKFSNAAFERKLKLRSTLRRASMLERLCLLHLPT